VSPITCKSVESNPISTHGEGNSETQRNEIDSVQILHSNPQTGSEECDGASSGGPSKRMTRSERSETKRYHTAGAIEDIKVKM